LQKGGKENGDPLDLSTKQQERSSLNATQAMVLDLSTKNLRSIPRDGPQRSPIDQRSPLDLSVVNKQRLLPRRPPHQSIASKKLDQVEKQYDLQQYYEDISDAVSYFK
jgi:hypothetical protein